MLNVLSWLVLINLVSNPGQSTKCRFETGSLCPSNVAKCSIWVIWKLFHSRLKIQIWLWMPMANHFPFDVISTLKGTQKQVTLQKFRMWGQINCLEKGFKICHISFILYTKTQSWFFHFVLCTLFFSLMSALVYVDINQGGVQEKEK